MRSRFVRAAVVIGALFMAFLVASCIYLGMGFGPLACDGQLGEKWSFWAPQQGHMNQ